MNQYLLIGKQQRHACLHPSEKRIAYAWLKYQEISKTWVQTKPYEDAPKTDIPGRPSTKYWYHCLRPEDPPQNDGQDEEWPCSITETIKEILQKLE